MTIRTSEHTWLTGARGQSRLMIKFAKVPVAATTPPKAPTEIECVADVGRTGVLLGVEILGLAGHLDVKPNSIQPFQQGTVRVSYDAGDDALYLRLLDDASSSQAVVVGILSISEGVVAVDVTVDELCLGEPR